MGWQAGARGPEQGFGFVAEEGGNPHAFAPWKFGGAGSGSGLVDACLNS